MRNVLDLAASGRAADVMRDIRVRSLYSPYYFAKVALGYRKLVDHLHLHDTELFVDRWAKGVTRQFIEWPRAFYKTTTFTISCGMWTVLPVTEEDHEYALNTLGYTEDEWFSRVALHDQDATQLYAFETETNAKNKVRIVKWHFEQNELFRTVFPEIAYTGDEPKWAENGITIRRVGERRKDAEGTFDAIGVGGALQSRHYKQVWEDDLVGEKARKSPVVMQDTIEWHGRLSGAFESAARKIQFGVSNRWGYADLNSSIREREPEVVFYTRSAWEIDPVTGKEMPIFPEEYPMEALWRIKEKEGLTDYDFACQYLNSPTLPGEREVNANNVHVYSVGDKGRMECSCGAKWYPSQCNRYMHYDPYNAKGAASTSRPCLVVVAASPDEHVFLLDYFLGKDEYGRVYDRMFHMNDIWRPIEFTYEDVRHQNMTEFHWRTIARTAEYTAKHNKPPRITPVTTGNRAKEQRIREFFFPVVEKKKFAVRSTHQAFFRMLDTFPHRVPDHDYDLLDALAQGAGLWRFPPTADYALQEQADDAEYIEKLQRPYCAGVEL